MQLYRGRSLNPYRNVQQYRTSQPCTDLLFTDEWRKEQNLNLRHCMSYCLLSKYAYNYGVYAVVDRTIQNA